MREKLVNELMMRIAYMDSDILAAVKKDLTIVLDNYDVELRNTELVPYGQVPEALKTYLVTIKIQGLSDKTIDLYAYQLKRFFGRINKPFNRMTTNDILVFLYNLKNDTGMSDRTLDCARGIICTFYKWAAANGYVDKDPCANIKPIKYEKKERGFLDDMEMEKLRGACKTDREKAMIETFYSTACRVQELVNIKISDIDFGRGEIHLFGKGSKHRQAYINAKAELAIRKYMKTRKGDSEYLFVAGRAPYNPLSTVIVERDVSRLGREAGIQRKVFPHLIRHTVATQAIRRGADIEVVRKMLGHESISTSLIYAKVADSQVKDAHKRCII